jgi:predicted nucleic acid-binding protein
VSVIDASVVVEVLLRAPLAAACEARLARSPSLHAPHLLDLEVTQVLRGHCLAGRIPEGRGARAVARLRELPIERWHHGPLLPRIWALRDTVTAYDAAYLALAETLGRPLVTLDGRVARSPGHAAEIDLVEQAVH